jgi:hypothetical protein
MSVATAVIERGISSLRLHRIALHCRGTAFCGRIMTKVLCGAIKTIERSVLVFPDGPSAR